MMTDAAPEQQNESGAIDFSGMLDALAQPRAFPYTLRGDEPITVMQTHASAVLLAGERAYKLKKPKNFGFFDFSTPALRRHFCGQEVLVNRRLAPHIYLGVAPVLLDGDGQFRFGPTFPPEQAPPPGQLLGGGAVVDYAVVMVRLPDDAMLEALVRAGTATPALLAEIARFVAEFHARVPATAHIASFGELEVIRGNWEENFAQMKPYIGRTLAMATYERIVEYVHHFLEDRAALFASRVRDGRIRDCHGDLRLQHVYVLGTPGVAGAQAGSIVILDGIEFNERFRYSDVTSEVAFLVMELDAAGRPDLSRAFVESYVAATGDDALRELLPFYTCYRACVRGKVCSFQLDEVEVPPVQREAAREQAAALFSLAEGYTGSPTKPTLLLVGGLMGTGKSTLALALQRELGWALFSSDALRKRLAGCDPALPLPEAFGQGIYSREWTRRTYEALVQEAGRALADGRSVLLDASFLERAERQAVARLAAQYRARTIFVECTCPRELLLQRLAQRWKARMEGQQEGVTAASNASDARPDLFDAQAACWEVFEPEEESGIEHLVVTTAQPLAASLEQVLAALRKEGKGMFQRIGVPLDGSVRAEQALPVAARLARASAGTIIFIHVVNPRRDMGPYYPSDPEVIQAMVHDEQVAARNYLESVARSSLLAGVRTEAAVLCGQPANRILSEVQASQIDLIVMPTHSDSGIKRWMSESLVEKIVSDAPIPVLVLREEHALPLASAGPGSGSLRALVPLDGSIYAEAALAPAAQLVAMLSAPAPGALHLARVVVLPDAGGRSESERTTILREAQHALESTVERLSEGLIATPFAAPRPSISWSATIDDDIASGISRLAEEGEDAENAAVPEGVGRADLVVMATRGSGGGQRGVTSSFTARVLHTTSLPVLVVPPPGMAHKSYPVDDEEASLALANKRI